MPGRCHVPRSPALCAIIAARTSHKPGTGEMSEQQGEPTGENTQLRVLIANERPDRLALLTELLARIGHIVVAGSVEVEEIGATTRREHPDVALVALGESSEHALAMISKCARAAARPVIARLQ